MRNNRGSNLTVLSVLLEKVKHSKANWDGRNTSEENSMMVRTVMTIDKWS